ncbi:MAG: hypothetical protein JW716_06030, partial [Candidatus Aenigmarchaeota archaeon]|nr:hypothetical protein [Candidatus Aenigmarchaeota archaeon]
MRISHYNSLLLGIILVSILFLPMCSAALTFEQKKEAWLEREGELMIGGYPPEHWGCHRVWSYVFAWLENNSHKQCSPDRSDLDCTEELVENLITMQGCSFTDNSALYLAPTAARVYFQYKDKISPELYQKLKRQLSYIVTDRYAFSFGPCDWQRTQQYISYIKYLMALEQNEVVAPYGMSSCNHCFDYTGSSCWDMKDLSEFPECGCWTAQSFTWDGKNYEAGQEYIVYESSRDWIYTHFDYWLTHQVAEFDTIGYNTVGLNALLLLYDFADRPLERLGGQPDPGGVEMKKRAKMMTDLYLLDSAMDFAGDHRGGVQGRSKQYYFTISEDAFPFYQYFNLPNTNARNTHADVAYASTYRVPSVIYDAGNLDDEPDSYWHINREERKNKINYVTKYYSIGSNAYNAWVMDISSDDDGDPRRGYFFSLWMNNEKYGMREDDVEALLLGEGGYQYKNFMYIVNDGYCHTNGWGPGDCTERIIKLHIFRPESYQFDEGEENLIPVAEGNYVYQLRNRGDWNFFREGKTMFGIRINGEHEAFLETGVLGADYDTFDDFKNAVRSNVRVVGNWQTDNDGLMYLMVQNSKGEKIKIKRMERGGLEGFDPQGNSLYNSNRRIETLDNEGEKIISWEGNKMTVRRHGRECVYDFDAWIYSGNGCTELFLSCSDQNGFICSESQVCTDNFIEANDTER